MGKVREVLKRMVAWFRGQSISEKIGIGIGISVLIFGTLGLILLVVGLLLIVDWVWDLAVK